MHQHDSIARQRSIRDKQSVLCRFNKGEEPDWDRIAEVAVEDGVPARYAGTRRSQFKEQPEFKPISTALDELMQPYEGKEGLVLYSTTPHWAGRVAAAVYSGAMVRGRGAKWVRFSELSDGFHRKIQLDQAEAWDNGEVRDWHFDLDSMKFCYDLLVIDSVSRVGLSSYVATELWKILDARAARGLFTVISVKLVDRNRLWEGYDDIAELIEQQYYKTREE